jgi:DNA-binding transcriptional ArsR family regulator
MSSEAAGASPTRPPLMIERPDQLKALGHPLRLRILELLADSNARTNRELASQLGVDPGRLHFHVRMLLRAGLLEPAPGGHGREKPYRATAGRLQASPDLRAAGLLGGAQGALIESVTRGWAAYGGQGHFRSVKATAHVSPETLQRLLREFFEQVRLAENAAVAAGDAPEELIVTVFHHPPPPPTGQGEPAGGEPDPA